MARRNTRPDLKHQLSFLQGKLPFFLLAFGLVFFQMWKVLVTQDLQSQVFREERLCASYEGELQLLRTRYQQLTAFATIEREGRALGLVWPEQAVSRIVLERGQGRRAQLGAAGGRP